jgi:hypothetical protein
VRRPHVVFLVVDAAQQVLDLIVFAAIEGAVADSMIEGPLELVQPRIEVPAIGLCDGLVDRI